MRRRVEETLDLLGVADLRHRDLRTLSGGQQQRVAIGSVLTMHPRLLVLDEPTSALDPTAAEDVLATLTRLVHDLGVSVLLAEHRLERVVPFADRMALLTVARGGGVRVEVGEPADVLADSPVVPPLVELGRYAGWSPLPLSVREARRRLASSDAELAAREPAGRPISRISTPPRPPRRSPPRPDRGARPDGRGARGRRWTCRGPGDRADGAQRVREVVAAVGAAGLRAAALGHGRRRRRRTRPTLTPADRRTRSACCRRPPRTCSTSRPSTRSARPGARAAGDPRRPGARRARRPAPARPLRGPAAGARAGAGAGRRAAGAAARRAHPRPRLRRQAGPGRHPAPARRRRPRGPGLDPRRGVRRRRSPTTSWCSPRARSCRRDRYGACSPSRPRSRPRSPRCSGRRGCGSTRSRPAPRSEARRST